MKVPWKTKEDPVILLLDTILDEMRATRAEHGEILDKLTAMTDRASGE